jgi:putative FmdB family regulatory protein
MEMPVYEYKCEACGRKLEVMQKFSDPLLAECPHCHGRLKKLISNTSFVLRGTGWYVTDYARGHATQAQKGHATPAQKGHATPAQKGHATQACKQETAVPAAGKSEAGGQSEKPAPKPESKPETGK